MKNLTFGAAMALSVAASTAQSQNAAPTMLMDELVVKKDNRRLGSEFEQPSSYIDPVHSGRCCCDGC
jgi:hypothetical protein